MSTRQNWDAATSKLGPWKRCRPTTSKLGPRQRCGPAASKVGPRQRCGPAISKLGPWQRCGPAASKLKPQQRCRPATSKLGPWLRCRPAARPKSRMERPHRHVPLLLACNMGIHKVHAQKPCYRVTKANNINKSHKTAAWPLCGGGAGSIHSSPGYSPWQGVKTLKAHCSLPLVNDLMTM